MKAYWKYLVVLPILLLSACDQRSPTGPSDGIVELDPTPLHTEGGADGVYTAGDTANIVAEIENGVGAPQWFRDAVGDAAEVWNTEAFGLAGHADDLPYFNTSVYGGGNPGGDTYRVIYLDQSSDPPPPVGTGYCGVFNGEVGDDRQVTIYKKDMDDTCGGRIVNDLHGVLLHEMSHALGFSHQSTSQTQYCVTNVPETGQLNQHLCIWEQQTIYSAYGIRGTSDPVPSTRIADKIIKYSGPDTVETGSSITVKVKGLYGPEASEPPPQSDPDTIDVVIDWTENSSFISLGAENDSTVVINGLQVGTAQVISQATVQDEAAYPWPADTFEVVVVAGSSLDPEFQMTTGTWKETDQYVIATGTTGAGIEYQWQFEDGGAWTDWQADTLYEFLGHSSADTYDVTMRIKDASSQESSTKLVTVFDSVVSVSGPIWVTDKKLKQYTSNYSSDWFERLDPATSLVYTAKSTGTSSYNRIWAAGEYFVRVRAEVDVANLGRDFVDVEVCTGCQAQVVMGPSVGLAWSFFGGGPWVSSGSFSDRRLVRGYDLTGLHGEEGPFATADWLAGDGGVLEQDGLRIEWAEPIQLADDVLAVDFVVRPFGSASYVYGFAVDPDLGTYAGNDHGGYDAALGLAYAYESGGAVGYLLMADGQSVVHTVNQYGARVHAPRRLDRAWDAHRLSDRAANSAADDVQFIIGGPEVSGDSQWRFVMIRAADPTSLRSRALELLQGDGPAID